jgi:hypothetical protein
MHDTDVGRHEVGDVPVMKRRNGWKWAVGAVAALVVLPPLLGIGRPSVPPPPQQRPMSPAVRAAMQKVMAATAGDMRRMTPQLRAYMAAVAKKEGVTIPLPPLDRIAPSKKPLPRLTKAAKARVNAIYERTGGKWDNLTREERVFIQPFIDHGVHPPL